MQIVVRVFTALSGLCLLVTAYLHYTGTSMVRNALEGAEMSQFLVEALPTIWLVFSWHLIVMAVPLLIVAVRHTDCLDKITVFCGVVALGDFLWVYSVAKWFPGTYLLISVVIMLMISLMIQFYQARTKPL